MEMDSYRTNACKESHRISDPPEMISTFEILMVEKAAQNGSAVRRSRSNELSENRGTSAQKPIFSKVFRWQPADGLTSAPVKVELVGSFTDWSAKPLVRDSNTNTWQLTLHGIPGNRTHRYMLLVNGQPVHDRHADGLAVPETFDEQRFQLMTPRGPRL